MYCECGITMTIDHPLSQLHLRESKLKLQCYPHMNRLCYVLAQRLLNHL